MSGRKKDGSYSYSENENVFRKGRITFFGGDERKWLKEIDEEALLHEVMRIRASKKEFMNPVSVEKVCEGHRIRFTQNQMRALRFYTEEIHGKENEKIS